MRLFCGLLLIATGCLGSAAFSSIAASPASGVHPLFDLSSPDRSPLPSDRFTVADPDQNTGRRVNLAMPDDCVANASDCEDVAVLNHLDGFNMQARISVAFDGEIDPASITSSTVFLLNLGEALARGQRQVQLPPNPIVGINYIVWDPATQELSFRPDSSLEQHTSYALVVTTAVRDASGTAIGVAEDFRNFRRDLAHDRDRYYRRALLSAERAVRRAVDLPHGVEVAALSVFTTQTATHIMERIRDAVQAAPAPAIDFAVGPGGSRAVFSVPSLQSVTFSAPAVQIVSPGGSIQEAVDRAPKGGVVLIRPGTYIESRDATNGLNLTRSVHLIGLSAPGKPVILRNPGWQANGIAAVPAEHTDCRRCHSTLAPPFTTHPWVEMTVSHDPEIDGLTVAGLTIEGFTNNGLFTRNVSNFRIVDVHSVDNANYGIFPTLSQDGLIAGSSATGSRDSGIWIETSKRVTATGNTMLGNVIGMEISNSEDIFVSHNQIRDNSIGVAILYLRHLFAQAPDMQRVTFRHNTIVGNNRPNFAEPDTLVSTLPPGVGLFLLGADLTLIADNTFRDHRLAGLGIVDYCVGVSGTPRDCTIDTRITPEFLLDASASNNVVVRNRFANNGFDPPPHPFAFAAGDIGLLTFGDHRNCFAANTFVSFFSLIGTLPDCRGTGGPVP